MAKEAFHGSAVTLPVRAAIANSPEAVLAETTAPPKPGTSCQARDRGHGFGKFEDSRENPCPG
ncbi:hypothetical protein BS329_12140 [Amycolatopsis coloradensis]|uniref:Uncharacterized protein n=1 Tax=Amycolatopsis coloradensis TaxID=76021 RepID=A0A1R0KWY8_9PSEU|nr:hypothetical protein BS329_12140 [Amycolatopsis coloradensis]